MRNGTTHLAHDERVTGIDTRNQTQRSDQGSSGIGQDITVEVGRYDDIKGIWLSEETVDHRIDNLFVHFDPCEATWPTDFGVVVLLDGADRLSEEAVRGRQNIGLVAHRDLVKGSGSNGPQPALELLASESDLEGLPADTSRGSLRDLTDRFGYLTVRSLFDGL